MVFVVGADDAVGSQERLVIDAQPDHREVPIAKAHGFVACGGEGKKFVGPVVDGQHPFFVEGAHGDLEMGGRFDRENPDFNVRGLGKNQWIVTTTGKHGFQLVFKGLIDLWPFKYKR